MLVQLNLIAKGRVQGVGFRATAHQLARKRGLRGYVRNCSDGSVEVVAQGTKEELEQFVTELKVEFRIKELESKFSDVEAELEPFSIRF